MRHEGYFRVTYEIVTPESAEYGDAEKRGFLAPGGWRDDEPQYMTLREALRLCSPIEDSGHWWRGEASQNCRTGAWETRAIHPPSLITAASYARITRIMGVK